MTKNIAASVRAKLLNISRNERKAFDLILLLYMQERLLYRLSISNYRDRFVLKGGLFLYSITQFRSRPTKDIDFLAKQISNDIENIQDIFKGVCDISVEDGIIFDKDSVKVERIKEDADYEGVRVIIYGTLAQAKKKLQLDIGFGDIVVPKPKDMEYPTLLEMENPNIMVYSLESVIAEKFQAAIALSIANSRLKDFYDIYILLSSYDFDGRKLQEAVYETLERRRTPLEKNHVVFSSSFVEDEDRIKQWNAFLNRTGLARDILFKDVMEKFNRFLLPIYDAIIHEDEFFGKWNKELFKWET